MAKLPAFMFYPGDWMKDPALRSCSVAARGLWTDMLCLMFESDRRGYLQHVTGKPVTAEQLARMTGCSTDDVSQLLQELEDCGVFSRTEHGVIYSRRLVGDERKRQLCEAAGKKGGNPTLMGGVKGHAKGGLKGDPNPNPTPSYSVSHSVSNTEQKTKPSVEPARPAGIVEEVFKYWQTELNHPQSVLDDKRRKVITARIKEGYTQERIMQAIRGIKLSPHNMGQNDRNTKFDDIELICRTGANVDRFADMVPATQPAKTEPPKRTPCENCNGDGLIPSGNRSYRCPNCRNWEGRYGDAIPFYRTNTTGSEGAQ